MHNRVAVKNYADLPEYDRNEILRYAGVRGQADGGVQTLLDECLRECESVFSPRVCWLRCTAAEFFRCFLQSKTAETWTEGCNEVLLFAATVGVGIDRLINRYANVKPAKALLFQAIGAERIEALCDRFCEGIKESGEYPQRRFSPGYGDFPLEAQKVIFQWLTPSKHIGVGLTESLLMTPTKSVTAVVGLKNAPCATEKDGCGGCNKTDCEYKKA